MSDTVSGLQNRSGGVADTARDEAGGVAETARQEASYVASEAADQARAVATDARTEARKVVSQGRDQLREQAREQSARAAGSLDDLSRQLRAMAEGRGAPEGPVRDITCQAADTASRFARELQNRSPDQLLAETKRFARQRPGLFVLGALAAGFLAGRVIRSVDTGAIVDAAKSGAGMGNGSSSQQQGVYGQPEQMLPPATGAPAIPPAPIAPAVDVPPGGYSSGNQEAW